MNRDPDDLVCAAGVRRHPIVMAAFQHFEQGARIQCNTSQSDFHVIIRVTSYVNIIVSIIVFAFIVPFAMAGVQPDDNSDPAIGVFRMISKEWTRFCPLY